MRSIHTKEYYLTIKRKEILTQATTWIKLEDIMQSEISQSQKIRCMIPFIGGTENRQNHRDRK